MALAVGWRGAIVGDDLGAGAAADYLIDQTNSPVTTAYGYLDTEDFVALIAAADVVVTPYAVASQSGVLAVAQRLGTPSAALDIGGLGEQATVVARGHSPSDLCDAIMAAQGRRTATVEEDVAKRYLAAYDRACDMAVLRRRHGA
jgi:hypothetical protein